MINLYRILSYLSGPLLKIYFYCRCLYAKDSWATVKNHFGDATKVRPKGRLIWIHAASVGESTSALTYINHLLEKDANVSVLLTTITLTSANILEKKLKNIPRCLHQFVVADNPFWVKKFLDYWKPEKVFFLESEIWPNIVTELDKRKIPFFLLNARLSSRSFKRWSFFQKDFSLLLSKFDKILAQSELDKQRYSTFSPQNTFKIDNLKYANAILPCNEKLLDQLKKLSNGRYVFVAASTHSGEEKIIIQAHLLLKKYFNLMTVIIPRHLNRKEELISLFKNNGLTYVFRSEIEKADDKAEIVCVDTYGEVGTCFCLTSVTFVGGSLVPIGGHNIYEPVVFGKPVLFGPYMDNALEVRDIIREKGVGFEVRTAEDIFKYCKEFFLDVAKTSKIQKKAMELTKNNSLQQIDELIENTNSRSKY